MPDIPKLHINYTGEFPPETVALSPGGEAVLRKLLKAGIYKELFHRNVITAAQLNELLNHLTL